MGNKNHIRRLLLLFVMLLCSISLYYFARIAGKALRAGMLPDADTMAQIALRCSSSVLVLGICAALIAASSLVFQTITENQILTPGLMGIDSVFLAAEYLLLLGAGKSRQLKNLLTNPYSQFAVTALVLLLLSGFLYRALVKKSRNNIVFLLLLGMILSGIVKTLTGYVDVPDPQLFGQLQAVSAVSVTNMNLSIFPFAVPFMILLTVFFFMKSGVYDVMELGESNAKSLGAAYAKEVNRSLVLIVLAMAAITFMIGPLAFLGLLAVSAARRLFRTYRHSVLFAGSMMLSVIFLVAGQGILELIQYFTPVTVLIDLAGGIYMIIFILKENRQ